MGEPGIGKSAIAARLATRMEVKGFILLHPDDADPCTPASFIRTLAGQFAAIFPAYRETLERIGAPDASAPPEEIFRTYIAEPLAACSDRPGAGKPWILVIDGLDEAAAGSGDGMIDFLAESLDRLPPWFRVIATTKPDQDVLDRFRGTGIRQLALEATSIDNMADLAEYTRIRAAEAGLDQIPDLVNRIGDAAAGNFRYARAALDMQFMPKCSVHLVAEKREDFEEVLHREYLRMVRGRFPAATHYKQEISPALACLAVLRSPVPEHLLLSALAQSPRIVVRNKDEQETTPPAGKDRKSLHVVRRRLRALSPFIVRDNDGLRLFHESFAEWLRDQWDVPNPYAPSPKEGSRRLAEACLQELAEKKAGVCSHVLFNLTGYLLEAGMDEKVPEVLANPYYITGIGKRNYEGLRIVWATVEQHNPLWRMQTLYGPVIEDPAGFDRSFGETVARLLLDAGYHDDALKLLRALEVIFTAKRERLRAAGTMTRQARVLIRRGSLAQAQVLLEKAIPIQGKFRNMEEFAQSLSCLGMIYHTRGDLGEALKIFTEQAGICRENQDAYGLLDALSSIALVYRSKGQTEMADQVLIQQAEIRQQYQWQSESARAKGIEALIRLDQGESRYATQLLQEQETLYRYLGDWTGVAGCLANQGFIWQAEGQYSRALETFQWEADICWEHGDRYGLARAYGNRGSVFLSLEKPDEAMAFFMEQEEICRGLEYLRGLSVSFANQALVHNLNKNHATALRLAETALALAREQGDANLISRIQSVLEEIRAGGE